MSPVRLRVRDAHLQLTLDCNISVPNFSKINQGYSVWEGIGFKH